MKYKNIFTYLFFGICTTAINMFVYDICFNRKGLSSAVSAMVAWVFAVIFAFITNKIFVFGSHLFALKVIAYEFVFFIGCRLLTGCIDVAIMYVTVDILSWNALFWKLLANMVVIVLNYIANKLVIFKKSE